MIPTVSFPICTVYAIINPIIPNSMVDLGYVGFSNQLGHWVELTQPEYQMRSVN